MEEVKMLNSTKLYNNYIRNYESDENLLKLYNYYAKIMQKLKINFYIRGVVCAETPFIYNFYITIEDRFYIIIIYFNRNSSSSSRVKKLKINFYIIFTGKWLQWD